MSRLLFTKKTKKKKKKKEKKYTERKKREGNIAGTINSVGNFIRSTGEFGSLFVIRSCLSTTGPMIESKGRPFCFSFHPVKFAEPCKKSDEPNSNEYKFKEDILELLRMIIETFARFDVTPNMTSCRTIVVLRSRKFQCHAMDVS